MGRHRQTKATAIPGKIKREVERRDGGLCIFCKRPGRGEAHFIGRAQGGLGIPENLLTVCRECHERMDNSQARGLMLQIAEAYLREHYTGWNKEALVYRKYKDQTFW